MSDAPPVPPAGPDPPAAFPPEGIPLGYASQLEQGRRGLAIWALVLGIGGLLFTLLCFPLGVLLALAGLIVGIIAIVKTSHAPQRYRGRGLAIGGLVCAAVALLLTPMVLAVLLPSLARARELAKRSVDSANLRGISQALAIYGQDHGVAAPSLDALVQQGLLTPTSLVSVSAGHSAAQTAPRAPGTTVLGTPGAVDYSYVVYPALKPGEPAYPSTWILIYDDPSLHGGDGGLVLFLDGHSEFLPAAAHAQAVQEFQVEYADRFGEPPTIIPPR